MSTNNAWNNNTVTVPLGGTNVTTLTQYGVLLGEGSSSISSVGPGTAGYALVGTSSADPTFVAPTQSGLTLTTNATTLEYTLPTPVTVANGGTDASSFTANTVMCGGTTSTGALQNVASVGTIGQILTSQGASSLPHFATPTDLVGNLVLIKTLTPSGTTASFTTGITNVSPNYFVIVNGANQASSGDLTFRMLFSVNGGSSYLTSNYKCGNNMSDYSSATVTNLSSTSECPLSYSASETTTTSVTGFIWLYNLGPSSTANPSYTGFFASGITNTTTMYFGQVFGYNTTTSGVNAIQFGWDTAETWNAGSVSLYQVLT